MKMTKKTTHAHRSQIRMAFKPTNEINSATTARMTIPRMSETWPSETAVKARPPVIHATAAQPSCWIPFNIATSLLGHQPKLYRLTLIWRKPVAAPNVAQYPLSEAARIEVKIVIKIDCLRVKPNSHPKKPVAKQDVFMVPLAHRNAMDSSSTQWTSRLSSGRLRVMASDSMPNFLSILASSARSLARTPVSCSTAL